MRRRLFRLASWLKTETCVHSWAAIDGPDGPGTPMRSALSDSVEARFRCARCEGVVVVTIHEAVWRTRGWRAAVDMFPLKPLPYRTRAWMWARRWALSRWWRLRHGVEC